MTTQLAKWGLIGVLIAALCWASYEWGAAAERAAVEKRIAEAAQEAVEAAEKEWEQKLDEAQARERAHQRRMDRVRESLRAQRDALAAYQGTDDAGQKCFEGRSLEIFNSF